MRRYEDAIKVFVDALIYIQRTRTMLQAPTRSLLNDMVETNQIFVAYFCTPKLNLFLLNKLLDNQTK